MPVEVNNSTSQKDDCWNTTNKLKIHNENICSDKFIVQKGIVKFSHLGLTLRLNKCM